MSSPRLWLASLSVVLTFAAVPDDASAFCQMTTEGSAQVGEAACVEDGAPLVWSNPCLSYSIDERGSVWMEDEDVEAAVNLAFGARENADCAGSPPNLVFQARGPSTCKRAECNGDGSGNVNTIAFLDPWRDPCTEGVCNGGENNGEVCTNDGDCPGGTCVMPGYDRNAFAVTIVWHNTSTGEILDADMMINDTVSSRFNAGGPYANCPEGGCEGNFADLGSIVTHEAGHFIGIGHCNPDDPEDPEDPCVQATMFAVAERASVNKRSLAQDDIDAVCTIYPPGSLEQDCDSQPIDGLQLDCETAEDGSAIKCDRPSCGGGSSSSGCSATKHPGDAPWGVILGALIGLTVWRRRRLFGARS